MAYTTTTTSITSATSSRSKQATVYQYPTGNGVVITGASVNSNTTAYLGVTTPGAAQSFTAVSGGATITEIVYLDADNVPTNANAVSTTGGNIKIVGTGFASNSQVYINNALVTNTVPNSTAIIATLTTGSVGNVSCYIFGSGNSGGAISANSVRFSGAPSWVTAAAVSSVNGIASNIALQASGDGTLTYALKSGSGSLPTGITLLSSGYLTGTATGYSADTVVTFTLIVRDTENQATQQTFNYTVFIGDTYFKQTSLLLSATVSNTFISDSSTNNFLITRNGDTRPSRLSPYWPGGWSGYFDGSGDYLTVAHNTGFDFGTGDFTIEFWLYQSVQNADKFLVDTYFFNGSVELGWNVSLQAQGKLIFNTFVTSGNFGSSVTSASAIAVNKWVHCAAVRSGTTVTLYIDGLSAGSGTVSTNIAYTRPLQIAAGGYYNGPYLYFFNGYLTNIRILKGTALYTANFTPSTTSLTTIANTSVLLLRDSILVDNSPYNGLVTRGGDTKLTTFSPFNTAPHTIAANTNSVYFDGTGDYLSVADNANFELGSNNFTLETWVNFIVLPSTNGYQATLFSKWATSNAAYELYLYNNAGTYQLYFTYSTNGSASTNLGVNWTPVVNTWYHVACVRNGSNLTFYVNGTQQGAVQSISATIYNGTAALELGGFNGGGANTILNGYLSNSRLVNGTAVYTANFTPATSALTSIANTSILACQANTIIDSNTTPKTITVNGNPNVSLANPFGETVTTISNYTWSANSYGASAYFDGTGDYLSIPTTTALQMTGDFTWEAWIYPTSLPSSGVYKTLWAQRAVEAGFGGPSVSFTSAGDFILFISNSAGNGWAVSGFTPGLTVTLNVWQHIALVKNGTTLTLYKNGIAGTSTTHSQAVGTSGNTTLMAGAADGNQSMSGYMSDFRAVKGTALYTGPFIPPTAPVSNVANVSLLTLQSDIGSNSAQFLDQSPNNHLITRNGNASQGTYSPLVPSTWSAYFDGTGDYLSLTGVSLSSINFTIEGWVFFSSFATTSPHIFSFGVDANNRYALYRSPTSGKFIFGVVAGGVYTLPDSLTSPVVGNWYHFAVVSNSSVTTLYINGLAESTNSVAINSGTNWVIGFMQFTGGANDYLTGYVSNFRVVKGTALYTANFTPSTTTISPIANTSLLTVRGPSFTDDSGNNFTITRNGDTKIVPFGPFSPQIVTPDSYSYRFSNASDYISTTSSNLAFGANNWTIEGWVYPRFTANSGIFQVSNVQYGLTNSNLNTVALGFSNSNKAIVRVANATYTSTGTSITANAWTHLALVKNSNVSKLYINGTLDSTIGTSGSITDTVSYTGTTNVAVGGYGSTGALANAYISNFRIVSNSAVYTDNFTPAVGPLSAISGTTLLTCQANTVLDSSTANLTITANANVSPSNFNPFDETVTVGQQYSALADGGSAYFDGTGDYLALSSSLTALGNGDFTVEFWLYPNSSFSGTYAGILDSRTSVNGAGLTSVGYTNTANQIGWWDNVTFRVTGLVTLTAWNHVAFVRSGSILTMYVNGASVSTATYTQNLTVAFNRLGSTFDGYYFNGYISNLRFVKGTAIYTSNFVPPATPALPTVANTSLLLNFTSSGVIDSTGRNILETVADAKVTTNLKKYGTGSYYFDGTGDYMYVMGNSTELAFGAGDFTVEFWYYPSSAGSQEIFYDSRPATTQGAYLVIYKQSTNVIAIYVSSAARITGTTALSANTWYHIALARSGTSTKLFLNGTQEGSTYTDTTSYLNSTSRPIIGGAGDSLGSNMVNGYLTDLRVTKGYARYTANFTVPSEPFTIK